MTHQDKQGGLTPTADVLSVLGRPKSEDSSSPSNPHELAQRLQAWLADVNQRHADQGLSVGHDRRCPENQGDDDAPAYERWRSRLQDAGVGRREARYAIGPEHQSTQVVQGLRAVMDQGDPTVTLIAGRDVGSGKSVASAVWLLHHLRRGHAGTSRSLMWASAVQMSLWSTSYESAAHFQKIRGAPLLVIQDLGAEAALKPAVWHAALFDLLDHRYSEELRTCITTNLEGDALRQSYGVRFYDRLRAAGPMVLARGKSLRRANVGAHATHDPMNPVAIDQHADRFQTSRFPVYNRSITG